MSGSRFAIAPSPTEYAHLHTRARLAAANLLAARLAAITAATPSTPPRRRASDHTVEETRAEADWLLAIVARQWPDTPEVRTRRRQVILRDVWSQHAERGVA